MTVAGSTSECQIKAACRSKLEREKLDAPAKEAASRAQVQLVSKLVVDAFAAACAAHGEVYLPAGMQKQVRLPFVGAQRNVAIDTLEAPDLLVPNHAESCQGCHREITTLHK